MTDTDSDGVFETRLPPESGGIAITGILYGESEDGEDGNVQVDFRNPEGNTLTVAVASYTSQGQLIDYASPVATDGNSVRVSLNTDGARYVRAFILDEQYRPCCPQKQTELPAPQE